MNIMQVEIITRDSGNVLAVACPKNGLISEAGIGEGGERAAVIQAINSYYNRREQREQASTTTPAIQAVNSYDNHVRRSATVAVESSQIRGLLERAIDTNARVQLTGTKVSGSPYSREVIPYGIVGGTVHDYVNCGTDEGMRTFRLDGIERAEILYARSSA